MYQSISVPVAQARHSDMVARAERKRYVREARQIAAASQPSAARRRGPWRLVLNLRPQVQS